jgi:DNA-binding GntR family transcriptional regulator
MTATQRTRAGEITAPRAHALRMKPNVALSRQIYDLLRDQICSFALKPFEQISEQAIAAGLGVSRTPVREALARLSELGFVDIFPQSGTIIAPLRVPDLEKSQFLREALELAILRQAMESPGAGELVQRLRMEIAVQKTFVDVRDSGRFYIADEEFHAQIAKHAGLDPLMQEMGRAKAHMDRFRRLMVSGIDSLPLILDQHIAIVEAVEAGDGLAAESAMKTHLRRVLGFVDRARLAYPGYFDDEEAHPVRLSLRG